MKMIEFETVEELNKTLAEWEDTGEIYPKSIKTLALNNQAKFFVLTEINRNSQKPFRYNPRQKLS